MFKKDEFSFEDDFNYLYDKSDIDILQSTYTPFVDWKRSFIETSKKKTRNEARDNMCIGSPGGVKKGISFETNFVKDNPKNLQHANAILETSN